MAESKHVIAISRPLLDEREAEAVARVLRSGWVIQGPEVAAFEREFASEVGARHACAVSSGTAALHLALLGVGVRAGDEVVTASHSFIATANSIRYCGAVPVFVDIDRATGNLDPALLERALTTRTPRPRPRGGSAGARSRGSPPGRRACPTGARRGWRACAW